MILPVVLISLLISVGFAAVNLIIPYYLLALKGLLTEPPDILARVETREVALEFGAMTSAFMLTRTLFALVSGGLSDHFGRKKLIVTGMAIYVLVSILYVFTASVEELILLRALQGVASALVWPVAETLLVDLVPPFYRARALSLYVISMQVGHVAGPLVGVAAYMASRMLIHGDVITLLRAPFAIVALFTIPGLILATTLPETIQRSETRNSLASAALSFTSVFREVGDRVRRSLAAIYTNSLINGFTMGIFVSVATLFIMDRITANPIHIGITFAVASLVGMTTAYPMAGRIDRLDAARKKTVLIAAAFTARTTWLLIAFSSNILELLAALILAQVSFNILMPLMRTIQVELVPQNLRGRVFGMQQAFFNAGMIVGPMVGAYLYRAWKDLVLLGGLLSGDQLVFIMAALLGYVGAAVLALYYEPVSSPSAPRAP